MPQAFQFDVIYNAYQKVGLCVLSSCGLVGNCKIMKQDCKTRKNNAATVSNVM